MKKGFTLTEVMIVVAVIALLSSLAVPNILRSRLNANEHNAISNLQTISVAAQTYWSVKNTLPTALSQLHDEGYIDETFESQGCIKNGYRFYMAGSGTEASFYVYTVPQTPNVTGIRSFCAASDGVIRVGTTPATSDPL